MIRRIGIDFGNTIGDIDQRLPLVDKPSNSKVFNIIKMFIDKYDSHNVFIISKAKDAMQVKIINWLHNNNFFAITSFDENNIHFVNEHKDKKSLIIDLEIDIFIDDHYKVVSDIIDIKTLKYVYWFNNKADIKLLPKKYRDKVVVTVNWGKIWAAPWNKSKLIKFEI